MTEQELREMFAKGKRCQADRDGELKIVIPTDFKHPNTGALTPLENPHVWFYAEENKG